MCEVSSNYLLTSVWTVSHIHTHCQPLCNLVMVSCFSCCMDTCHWTLRHKEKISCLACNGNIGWMCLVVFCCVVFEWWATRKPMSWPTGLVINSHGLNTGLWPSLSSLPMKVFSCCVYLIPGIQGHFKGNLNMPISQCSYRFFKISICPPACDYISFMTYTITGYYFNLAYGCFIWWGEIYIRALAERPVVVLILHFSDLSGPNNSSVSGVFVEFKLKMICPCG